MKQNVKQNQEIKCSKEATVGKKTKKLRLVDTRKRFTKSIRCSYNVWNVPF